jgi:hypothetical protein
MRINNDKEQPMKLKAYGMAVLTTTALWLASPGYAQQPPATPGGSANTATPADQQIYGWQLMTPQERATYQNKMRSLKTQQEREQFRLEHHRLMQQRAQERGLTLPDEPVAPGRGPGGGPGPGMGPGAGGGPGAGPGMGGGGGRP